MSLGRSSIGYLFIYLNLASSDSKISKNSENNSIADDTGNRMEQIHLHGNRTWKHVQLKTSENVSLSDCHMFAYVGQVRTASESWSWTSMKTIRRHSGISVVLVPPVMTYLLTT